MSSGATVVNILNNLEFSVGKKYDSRHIVEMSAYLSSKYSTTQIIQACSIYLAKGKPYLAQICELEEIIRSMTYDTADQAWSKCMIAKDESKSLMISSIAIECFENVKDLYEYDKIGARRSFIDDYNKLMLTRPDSEKRLRLSLGTDSAQRNVAIAKAASVGVISASRAKMLTSGETGDAMSAHVPKLLEKPDRLDKKHEESMEEYRKRKWKENVETVRQALRRQEVKKNSKLSVDN